MAVKGHLVKELDTLGEHQLREVAEYVAFLKFRSRFMAPPSVDEELSKLCSEQAGIRPVLIFQSDLINRFTTTVLTIPVTTNLRRASLPSCVFISRGEGGLVSDSVAPVINCVFWIRVVCNGNLEQ